MATVTGSLRNKVLVLDDVTTGSLTVTGSVSGNVTFSGEIYAKDSNSTIDPTITFTGHTTTGLSVTNNGSQDELHFITGGTRRMHLNDAGITSFANVYTSSSSSFRNYAGTWKATTGLTGNGFEFSNTVDGTAMTLSSVGLMDLTGASAGVVARKGAFGPSQSGLHASYDLYNNGTTYLNGAVTVDDNLTVTGDLNITGDINSVSVTDLDVTDKTITLGVGQTEASSGGSGIVIDGSLAEIKWDESDDRWESNKTFYAATVNTDTITATANTDLQLNATTNFKLNLGGQTWISAERGGSTSPTNFTYFTGRLEADDFKLYEGTIDTKITHNGDTDTYIQFDTDRIRLFAGGTAKFDSNNTYQTTTGSGAGLTSLNASNITSGTLNVDRLQDRIFDSYRRSSISSSSHDFDTYLTTGTYHVDNWSDSGDLVQNGPTGSYPWGLLRVTNWQSNTGTSSGTGTYVLQEYFPHNTDTCWTRIMWNGSFTSWRESWGSGSDGSGSGLDADKLDAQDGSYYLNYNNFTNTPTISNYYLDGITKSGNTLTFSVNGATNQTYTFGSNAFNSTTIPTNNNQLTNGAGYITGESDTLGTVVSRGASTTNTVTMTGGIIGNSFRVRRQDNNGTIWFNGSSATDTNHALWNAYYGTSPTTRGAANSGFDGIYWNTYRGIHIRGGLAGAVDCIKVENSSGSNTDHTVELYASNVKRFETSTTGATIENELILGSYSDSTKQGKLILGGNVANVSAEIKCTNGNLHIDSEAGNSTYINYYEGTGGVAFGTGAGGVAAWMGSDGDLWKTSLGDNTGSRYFHDDYHPNADKWTTSRTLTLSGDVTGSVSWDGSGNATITTTVADNSHTHDTWNLNAAASSQNIDTAYANKFWSQDRATQTTLGTYPTQYSFVANLGGGKSQGIQLASQYGTSKDLWFRTGTDNSGSENGANVWKNWRKLFHDDYHPNADTWTSSRTLTLAGDLSGNVSFDGSANFTLTATVADDSHNHIIANVDGLQTALDAKLASSSYTASDVLTKIKTVDGSGSGLDADLLDGAQGSYYLNASNLNAGTVPTDRMSGTYNISISGQSGNTLRLVTGVSNPTSSPNPNLFSSGIISDTRNNTADGLSDGGTRHLVLTLRNFGSGFDATGGGARQLAFTDNDNMWIRGSGTTLTEWGSWAKVWTSLNDGPGTDMDADKLDNRQGTWYQNAYNMNFGILSDNRLPEYFTQKKINTSLAILSTSGNPRYKIYISGLILTSTPFLPGQIVNLYNNLLIVSGSTPFLNSITTLIPSRLDSSLISLIPSIFLSLTNCAIFSINIDLLT